MYYRPFTTRCSSRSALRLSAIAALLFALAAGCNPPGRPDPANRPITPDQIVDFDQLYAANCAGCHGATGKLGPAPPLSNPLFVAIVPDEELMRVIRDGRVGTPMPAFSRTNGGSLTDNQVKLLAEGIKSHWRSATPLTVTPHAYALAKGEGLQSTLGNREHGADVFRRACAGCHGP